MDSLNPNQNANASKMTIPQVIESLNSTAKMRSAVFGPDDSSVKTARDMADAVEKLYDAALVTLRDNAHLADGDDCTLIKLKRAVGE